MSILIFSKKAVNEKSLETVLVTWQASMIKLFSQKIKL